MKKNKTLYKPLFIIKRESTKKIYIKSTVRGSMQVDIPSIPLTIFFIHNSALIDNKFPLIIDINKERNVKVILPKSYLVGDNTKI